MHSNSIPVETTDHQRSFKSRDYDVRNDARFNVGTDLTLLDPAVTMRLISAFQTVAESVDQLVVIM